MMLVIFVLWSGGIVANRNLYRHIRRRFDQLVDRALIRGSLLAVGLLLAGSLIIVFIGAVIVTVAQINLEKDRTAVLDVAWEVLLRAISPDQLANNDEWGARIVLLVVTIIGLLLVSTLISILNSVIERRMEFIHRGRGSVSMRDQIVILNWNKFGIRVVQEVAQAAEPGHAPRKIAILCDEDPVNLMHEIRDSLVNDISPGASKIHAHYLRHPENWIVVRRGQPTNTADLSHLTSVGSAQSVIILQHEIAEPAQALRVVLAIDSVLAKETAGGSSLERLPVVTFTHSGVLATQLDDRLSDIALAGHTQRRFINYIPLDPDHVRQGVEAQVSRHRGLSSVYQDLLNFGGQELYIVDGDRFGSTFGNLLLNSRYSIPICLIRDGQINFWPDWNSPLNQTSVVILAENRAVAESTPRTTNRLMSNIRPTPDVTQKVAEHFLFVGWNDDAARLADSLEKILPLKSELSIIRRPTELLPSPVTFRGASVTEHLLIGSDPLRNQSILDTVEHVIVFTDQSVDPGTSDTTVLIDLLACRHHANQMSDPHKRFTIVAELQKRSSRHIAGDRLADDLLINDALLASAAVQLALAPDLEDVFSSLLSVDDPIELITRPVSQWRTSVEGESWDDLIRITGSETGEIPIGYRRIIGNVPIVVMNPDRESVCMPDDEIVLLSRRSVSLAPMS